MGNLHVTAIYHLCRLIAFWPDDMKKAKARQFWKCSRVCNEPTPWGLPIVPASMLRTSPYVHCQVNFDSAWCAILLPTTIIMDDSSLSVPGRIS
ncbi:hypothetical protein I7I53_10065 [Histoplasma capsulatum var. duboisii H88]|uniref:Uncharacterized protein n=1 Tax=Ajellomyces capsulatus (strain H88) TaxID=544711 RepID=A0A8A1LB49_AJEC8|nr:hypothetical protein I7I53_10065 [Histoplasma capsulatum var. duboisii H88]